MIENHTTTRTTMFEEKLLTGPMALVNQPSKHGNLIPSQLNGWQSYNIRQSKHMHSTVLLFHYSIDCGTCL